MDTSSVLPNFYDYEKPILPESYVAKLRPKNDLRQPDRWSYQGVACYECFVNDAL